jgi:hypothetical protein
MAQSSVANGVSIRLACLAFGISRTCYRYQAKQAWLPEEKKADLRAQVTSLERELDRITSREQASQQQIAVTTADPLGQRLESAFGLKADAVTLALSLLVALVMEGLAVVMWRLALEQTETQRETPDLHHKQNVPKHWMDWQWLCQW